VSLALEGFAFLVVTVLLWLMIAERFGLNVLPWRKPRQQQQRIPSTGAF